MLLPLLVLGVVSQTTSPSFSRSIEDIRSAIPGDAACANPSADDWRPYTLCLSETWFDEAEAKMNRQLGFTVAHIQAARGARAARRFADEQLRWVKRRDRTCEKQMAGSPVTQFARNTLDCQTKLTEKRTVQLKALGIAK